MTRTEFTTEFIKRYVPKKKKDSIADVYHDGDGYDVLLADGWLFDNNNTMFKSPTIKDFKEDMQFVERLERKEWEEKMQQIGYTVEEIKNMNYQ